MSDLKLHQAEVTSANQDGVDVHEVGIQSGQRRPSRRVSLAGSADRVGLIKKFATLMVFVLLVSPAAKAQMETGMDVVESASQFAQIQYFHTLIVETGLEEKLREEGPFTIFAPTNQAFNDLPEGVMESLLENPDELRNILRAHISSGTMLFDDLANVENIPTFEGAVFELNQHEQGISIGEALIVAADVVAINGAIHAIDKVLIP